MGVNIPTHGEMIDDVSKELPEPFTKRELIDAIVRRYGSTRSINIQSLGTDIAGCCVNLKSHEHLPDLPLILVSLGLGLYRRYNLATDKHLNLYLREGKKALKRKPYKIKGKKYITIKSGNIKAFYYDFNNGEKTLQEKGLLSEIHRIIRSITKVNHRTIQDAFSQRGWEIEYKIHPEVNWAWDAYKNRVPVSIELSLIDAVHRDFLRLLLWEKQGRVDAMVYVTSTFTEVKFNNVKRDLNIFKSLIKIPILLIGLTPT